MGLLVLRDINIYTTKFCPFCIRVKKLLETKGIKFNEIDVTFDPEKRRKMGEMAGSLTVPQIFVDESHIGDCAEIFALNVNGELDLKLGLDG